MIITVASSSHGISSISVCSADSARVTCLPTLLGLRGGYPELDVILVYVITFVNGVNKASNFPKPCLMHAPAAQHFPKEDIACLSEVTGYHVITQFFPYALALDRDNFTPSLFLLDLGLNRFEYARVSELSIAVAMGYDLTPFSNISKYDAVNIVSNPIKIALYSWHD